jgi:hypothetical protein
VLNKRSASDGAAGTVDANGGQVTTGQSEGIVQPFGRDSVYGAASRIKPVMPEQVAPERAKLAPEAGLTLAAARRAVGEEREAGDRIDEFLAACHPSTSFAPRSGLLPFRAHRAMSPPIASPRHADDIVAGRASVMLG